MTDTTPAHDASMKILHALVDEIKAAAHDPALVHSIADKLKHGIDVLADAIAEQPKAEKK